MEKPAHEMQCWQPEQAHDRPLHYRTIFRALPPRPFAALEAIVPRRYSWRTNLLAAIILYGWRGLTRPRFSLAMMIFGGLIAAHLAVFFVRILP